MTQITILEGATFCVSDEFGDLGQPTTGFFDSDTRFLSRLALTVNGARPLLLSQGKVEYFSSVWFLRNPPVGGLRPDEVSIARRRFVGDGMQEHVILVNHADRPVEFELAVDVGTDFADIFAVKAFDLALGDPARALAAELVPAFFDEAENGFLLSATDDFDGQTQVLFSVRGEVEEGTVRYRISLEPRERWQLRIDVFAVQDGVQVQPRAAERHFGDEIDRIRASLSAWQLRVPQLRATWDDLGRAFGRSVSDLASLRMRGTGQHGQLPAAGMPWFMAVFGRDTLITCLQTLLFGPELAQSALHTLGEMQALEDDPEIDAEPGKIVHEVRKKKPAPPPRPGQTPHLHPELHYLMGLNH